MEFIIKKVHATQTDRQGCVTLTHIMASILTLLMMVHMVMTFFLVSPSGHTILRLKNKTTQFKAHTNCNNTTETTEITFVLNISFSYVHVFNKTSCDKSIISQY